MAITSLRWTLLAAALGCGPTLEYTAPPGFAAAQQDWRSAHYKGSDNVGLRLLVFDNVEGGTLQYWGRDLVRKLEARGYTYKGKSALAAENKVAGMRFNFELDRHDDETPIQFLVVGLFVTDDFRYVAQIAGDSALYGDYDARVPALVRSLKPKGCRARSTVCRKV